MNANSYTFLTSEFGIEIDYRKNSENPARVFQAMSDLIDALQRIDKRLIEVIDDNRTGLTAGRYSRRFH